MATIHFKIKQELKDKIVDAAELSERSLSNFCIFSLVKCAEITKFGGSLELEKALKQNGTK